MKPILFNTEMTNAILAGRKKSTRRIVKLPDTFAKSSAHLSLNGFDGNIAEFSLTKDLTCRAKARYHKGDVLYVRETWAEWSGGYVYKAGTSSEYPRSFVEKWHPSIHMPKEAARIFLEVEDVRIERLQDMTEYDVESEGYTGCPGETTVYFPEGGAEPCYNLDGMCQYNYWYCKHTLAQGFGRDVWDKTIDIDDMSKFGFDANPWVCVIDSHRTCKVD